ncbi:MAG: hypothetical protein RL394_1033 [Bacteroidota bacterium]|jgi:hypothetical protein
MKMKFTSEEVINSLEGIQRAEGSPFLFTRIQARMKKEENLPEIVFFKFITRPAFALAIAVFFIAINVYLVSNSFNRQNAMDDLGQPLAAEYVQHDLNPYETNELP